MDWFQPCAHTQYPVSAIYLTLQTCLEVNVIRKRMSFWWAPFRVPVSHRWRLILILPLHLCKSYSKAWNAGLRVMTSSHSMIPIRLALSCVACDRPTSRIVCRFLGQNAVLGCRKCYKQFKCSLEMLSTILATCGHFKTVAYIASIVKQYQRKRQRLVWEKRIRIWC